MKATLLLAGSLFCCLFNHLTAQNWQAETLRSNIVGAWTRTADFDQDGDPDILIQDGDSILWMENLRPGWVEHPVDGTFFNSAYGYVDVADVDGDGDTDVIKVPVNLGDGTEKLTWNENIDKGSAWEKHEIATMQAFAGWLQNAFGDLDGDGDLDIAMAEYYFANVPPKGALYWLEQTPTGWVKHSLRNTNHFYASLGDLDGDGDLDIAASYDSLFWLENQLPAETWTLHKVADGVGYNFLGFCQDLNGDGAPDIASAPVASNGGFSYFANPGWEEIIITPAQQLYIGPAGDIDGDGDPDVTYGGAGFGMTQAPGWSENTANGAAWVVHDIAPPTGLQMIPTGLADIDGDGDTDFVTLTFNTATGTGSALWFANPLIPSATSNPGGSQIKVQVFPNPTAGLVSLEITGLPFTDLHVQVTDVHGRLVERQVLEKPSTTTVSFDLRDQPAGVYWLKVGGESEMAVRRILKL